MLKSMELSELRALVENLVSGAQILQEAIDRQWLAENLKSIMASHYDIGMLSDVKKLDRGYINVSYEVETIKDDKKQKYFLRRYKRGIREEEVRFEHSIVKHLMKKQFSLSAGLVFKKNGTTYVKEIEERGDTKSEVYYAIFEFLNGEDKYTWDNPVCTDEELESAARVLAQYHSAVYDLQYEGKRYEAKIIDLLPTIAGNLMKYAKRTGTTKFDDYFLKQIDYSLGVIDSMARHIKKNDYNRMPQLAIHADFHLGNLKYRRGCVVGLFDFDWSKIDVRCYDVAFAITYTCTTWEGKEDGDLLLDRMALFLKAYQEEAEKLEGVGPLNRLEVQYLPLMIKASNLYLLNWGVDEYYIKKLNPYEYLIYLQHTVRTMRWIENNWKNLVDTIRGVF